MQPEKWPINKSHLPPPSSSSSIALAINLQECLYRQKTLLESEHHQKSRFRQSLEQQLRRYLTFYLNIIKRTSNPRVKITEEDLFGNTYNFVKQVALLVSKDYQIMAHLLQTQPQNSKLRQLIPSIVNILYENSVDDNFVAKDITKLATILAIKSIKNEAKPLEVSLMQEYLRRPECRRYGQVVSKSILLILTQNEGPTSRIIKDAKEYNRESFPSMNDAKTEAPLIINNKDQFGYLVKDYLKIIVSSEFHVPVCIRILFQGIKLQSGDNQDRLFSYLWGTLFKIYFEALKYPEQYEKTAKQQLKEAHERLSLFRSSFFALGNYLELDEPIRTIICQFLKSLLTLPSNILAEFENPSPPQIKMHASCFSVEEIVILLQCLLQSPQIKEINQKVATRVSKIYEMSEKFTEFSKSVPANQLYCIFYDLILPKQIDLDYQKKYQGFYNESKSKALIRQILTTIRPLQTYLLTCREDCFQKLLQRMEAQSNQEQAINPDKVSFFVNIRYLLWLTQNQDIQPVMREMLEQTNSNLKQWLLLFSQTKIYFTNAIYYLRGYSERARQIDNKLRQTILGISVNQYLSTYKLNICVSSPSSRQKQFHTNGKLVLIDHERIHLDKRDNCVHLKLKSKSSFENSLHIINFNQLIRAFCSLEEVKTSIVTGLDKVGINMNLFWFLGHIYDEAVLHPSFKNNPKGLKDYLEVLATRKIFRYIFPKEQTVKDLEIYNKLHYFRFLQPKHLGLQLKQIEPIWQLTNKYLDELDKASSTLKKLDSLKQFMKVINGILLANQKPNKHRIELIVMYALLKSQQKQLASNIYFMQIYTDPSRMLSGEGAFVTNLKAAINELQDLKFQKLVGIDSSSYNSQFQRRDKENPVRQKSQSVQFIKQ